MPESVRHIEMTWRCSACAAKNLGRHKVCQGCNHPKDGSERYEMPEDPSRAVSVTDADLLRMATAGPDWRCAYCGSDQRKLEGSCATCGASAVEGVVAKDDAAQPPAVVPPPGAPRRGGRRILVGVGAAAALAGGLVWNQRRPRDYDATVAGVSWEQAIQVERYKVNDHEGFKETMPQGAFETRSLGQRLHHHEKVLDGYDDERYTVEVPDGYRTESYTERVSCGQDCTTIPETCRETCTSDSNGFATCRTVCSGGGQRCTTRYCNEARTRQVPRTRSEWRTRKVPRYRQEPRYAEAFAWKVWEWEPARTVRAQGTDIRGLKWPDDGARTVGLLAGEQERETRSGNYRVLLRYDGQKKSVAFDVATPQEFAAFTSESKHTVHTEPGVILVDGKAVQPR